jgi:putative ATP-dependent endonuclease of the OLD family
MSKKQTSQEESTQKTEEKVETEGSRLAKLVVKNYRSIGSKGVEIDLDKIVVLVGANNAGKSSILSAYELAMSEASVTKSTLAQEDFHEGKFNEENPPQIELWTIVAENSPGEKWIDRTNKNGPLVCERWTWDRDGKPKRQGFLPGENNWSENSVPWGFAGVAQSRRPEPHRVDAFAPPDVQANEIKKLIKEILDEQVEQIARQENQEEYQALVKKIGQLQKLILENSSIAIKEINTELTKMLQQIFPNYKIDFKPKQQDLEKFLKMEADLFMGHNDGFSSTIERQGSGARRTLLWTALKFISERNRIKPKKKTPSKKTDDQTDIGIDDRPHLLLIDEPEICLHPSAIREVCSVLYNLPDSGKWQVMVTTHSPIFLDLSKDNKTIIRVDRDGKGEVQSTTIFRPERLQLGKDDKENLKLLNLCDPYVAEFMFGGKILIVEGDTEYTAFKYIQSNSESDIIRDTSNLHIVRARGKATIISLIKILNQFASEYTILHDSDPLPLPATNEKYKGTWTTNNNILEEAKKHPHFSDGKVRVVASLHNFEIASGAKNLVKDKPFKMYDTIRSNQDIFKKIESLLKALIDAGQDIPDGWVNWKNIKELEAKLTNTNSAT